MKNIIASASLLKTIVADRKIPTKDELDIILYTPDGTDNLGKIIYILGILSRYEPNSVKISESDAEYFKNFIDVCLEAYPVNYELTEEALSDIYKTYHIIDKINNVFPYGEPSEEEAVCIKELVTKMIDRAEENSSDIIYLISTFRFATVVISFAAGYYSIYSSVLSKCADFFIKHFNEIQNEYGVLIRV